MAEKAVTSFFLLFSCGYLYFANQFAFGTLQEPMSGFVPTLAGISGIFVSLLLLYRQFRGKSDLPAAEGADWTKFIFILIGLFFYLLLFKMLGYFMSTFVFLFYLFKLSEPEGWFAAFLFSLISAGTLDYLFKLLHVTLP